MVAGNEHHLIIGRFKQGKQQHTANITTILMDAFDQERKKDEGRKDEIRYGVLTEVL